MEKICLGIFLLFLTACNTPIMTTQGFEDIQPGTSIEVVEKEFGPPYQVETLPNGFQEYIYIQRTPISSLIDDHISYILYVCKGKVISKEVRNQSGSFDINYH